MKRVIYLVALLFLMSLTSAGAQEKPVVALFPMQNPTGEGWIDTLGNTVEEVVSLTLALMGNYVIERPEELPGDLSEEGLKSLARDKGYDDIILGECSVTDEGYRFSVTNYDLYKEQTTVRAEENFESLLDSFDAADRLTEALVEGLSGVKVRYGGLTLALFRDEPYRTVIDDVDVGDGFTGSDKFLVGPHTLRFFQDRGAGEVLVSEFDIEIQEGDTLTLKSPIPWLKPELAAELRELERQIAEEGDKVSRADLAEALFVEARSRVGGEFYSRYRPELFSRYADWEALYREPPADLSGLEHSSDHMKSMYLGRLPYNSLFTAPRELAASHLSEGAVLYKLLRSNSQEMTGTVLPDRAEIKVDGLADDWENVSTVIQDGVGDLENLHILSMNDEMYDGQDFEWFGLAMDRDKLYIAIKTVSGQFNRKREYALELHTNHILRINYNHKEHWCAVAETPDKDWNRSRWIDSTKYQTTFSQKEILEVSVPWKRILNFLEPSEFTLKARFMLQRDVEPWEQVDGFQFQLFIPDFYYALKAEEQE